MCEDIRSQLWLSKWLCFSTALNTIRKKMLRWMRTNHHIWGEPVPSATGVDDAAKSFSVTQCCHLWVSWGIALSLAPQQSPWWSRMLSSLTASCSLLSTESDRALDQHQPKQKCLPHSQSILPVTLKYSTCPDTQTQDELTVQKSCL